MPIPTQRTSAFTLIELMVVVVLVMILALALVPTFKEIIVKAKYTEGQAGLSAVRVALKVAYLSETNAYDLPDTLDRTMVFTDEGVTRLTNDEGIGLGVPPWKPATPVPTDDVLKLSNTLTGGRYFQSSDYQLRIERWIPGSNEWMYAAAVVGSGASRTAPPLGSAVAILEVSFPAGSPRKHLMCQWERYTPERDSERLFLQGGVESPKKTAKAIQIPPYTQIANADNPIELLEQYGWKAE